MAFFMPCCHRQLLDSRALVEDLKQRRCKETSPTGCKLYYLNTKQREHFQTKSELAMSKIKCIKTKHKRQAYKHIVSGYQDVPGHQWFCHLGTSGRDCGTPRVWACRSHQLRSTESHASHQNKCVEHPTCSFSPFQPVPQRGEATFRTLEYRSHTPDFFCELSRFRCTELHKTDASFGLKPTGNMTPLVTLGTVDFQSFVKHDFLHKAI